MNAATKKLKIAPMSAPSLTPIPTANPANPVRNHPCNPDLPMTSPSARKLIPIAITCDSTPQQAAEKKLELKTAANPPNIQAQRVRPIWWKKYHALKPSIISAIGAYNLENNTGPNSHCRANVILGTALPSRKPTALRSCQQPKNRSGRRWHSDMSLPSDPSFENCVWPGRKFPQSKTITAADNTRHVGQSPLLYILDEADVFNKDAQPQPLLQCVRSRPSNSLSRRSSGANSRLNCAFNSGESAGRLSKCRLERIHFSRIVRSATNNSRGSIGCIATAARRTNPSFNTHCNAELFTLLFPFITLKSVAICPESTPRNSSALQ